MAQPVKSKQDLIRRLNEAWATRNNSMRQELEQDLKSTDTRLWTDGGATTTKLKGGNQ